MLKFNRRIYKQLVLFNTQYHMAPGLTFVPDETKIRKIKIIIETISQRRIKSKHIYNSSKGNLISSSYSNYPIQSYKDDNYKIFIEGKIYSETQKNLVCDLKNIVQNKNGEKLSNDIGERLSTVDGDFIIFIFDRICERVLVLNDLLGRIPFYYTTNGQNTLASRSAIIFSKLFTNLEIDNLAVGQYLLFGYPLGSRTFYKNIRRMSPGELIVIKDSSTKYYNTHTFEIGNTEKRTKSIEQNAAEIAKIFSQVCENRTKDDGKNIVSLSGGLDSRSVLAGIAESKNSCAATFDHSRVDEPDITAALQLARAFNIDWHRFYIEEPLGDTLRELLFLKGGMNHLTSSYLLNFNKKLLENFGSKSVLFTGNGGDKVMPDLSPEKKLDSKEKLVDYILNNNSYHTLKHVSKKTNTSPSEIRQSIHDRLQSYPESSYDDMYVRFIIRERGMNRFFQSEDRDRCFFWTSSPFYSFTMFKEAMMVPNTQKEGNKFYDMFIEELDHKLLTVNNAMFAAPPGSLRHSTIRKSYSRLSEYNSLKNIINPIAKHILGLNKGKIDSDSAYVQIINDSISQNELDETVSTSYIKESISNSSNYTREELGNLLTVLQVIEYNNDGKITLDNYRDTQF